MKTASLAIASFLVLSNCAYLFPQMMGGAEEADTAVAEVPAAADPGLMVVSADDAGSVMVAADSAEAHGFDAVAAFRMDEYCQDLNGSEATEIPAPGVQATQTPEEIQRWYECR